MAKCVKNALHAPDVSSKWGGSQPKMRDTLVPSTGKYCYDDPVQIDLESEDTNKHIQQMQFSADHPGPFNLKEPQLSQQKYPRPTGKMKKRKRNMGELLHILEKYHQFKIDRRYFQKDLHEIAKSKKHTYRN